MTPWLVWIWIAVDWYICGVVLAAAELHWCKTECKYGCFVVDAAETSAGQVDQVFAALH